MEGWMALVLVPGLTAYFTFPSALGERTPTAPEALGLLGCLLMLVWRQPGLSRSVTALGAVLLGLAWRPGTLLLCSPRPPPTPGVLPRWWKAANVEMRTVSSYTSLKLQCYFTATCSGCLSRPGPPHLPSHHTPDGAHHSPQPFPCGRGWSPGLSVHARCCCPQRNRWGFVTITVWGRGPWLSEAEQLMGTRDLHFLGTRAMPASSALCRKSLGVTHPQAAEHTWCPLCLRPCPLVAGAQETVTHR